jgi:flagellar biosynthesis protein FlhF
VSRDLAARAVQEALTDSGRRLEPGTRVDRTALESRLAARVKSAPSASAPNDRPLGVLLMGPPGMGKTTAAAKLASRWALDEGRRVAILQVGPEAAPPDEGLREVASLLSLPLRTVADAADAERASRDLASADVLLLDAQGFAPPESGEIVGLYSVVAPVTLDERHLVLSASTKPDDLVAMARAYRPLEPDRTILTKLDETLTPGSVLDFLDRAPIPVSFLGTGQRVPEDLEIASPAGLVARVIGG